MLEVAEGEFKFAVQIPAPKNAIFVRYADGELIFHIVKH